MNATRHWFRTRWDALDLFMRVLVVVLAVLTVLVAVSGDWFNVVSSIAMLYIIADWQYWQDVGRTSKPVADFGAQLSKALRAAREQGHDMVPVYLIDGEWHVYTYGPQTESDET